MAVFTLQSLAPRGVSVVVATVRTSVCASARSPRRPSRTPEVRINPRHPSPNGERGFMPAQRPDDHAEYDRMAASAAYGAGRSLSCDGSPVVEPRESQLGIPLGWFKPQDRRVHRRQTLGHKRQSRVGNAALTSARRWPAGRTLSASTWAS